MKSTESFQDTLVRLYPTEVKSKKAVRTVTFQVTDACNLRCTYCYQKNKSDNVMSFETAKKFIELLLVDSNDYINRDNSLGIVLDFIGGEPFLEIDLISKITDYFITQMILLQHPWATKFKISISSNGTLYFEPKVQAYIKKHKPYLSLGITIDGNKKLHDACRKFPDGSGSYDIVEKAVKHYLSCGATHTKMTIAPDNVVYTAEAVIDLINLGYTQINANCVFENVWRQGHATILYYQLKTVADYLLDNGLHDKVFVSLFQEFIGCPIPEQDNQNWCGGLGYMLAVDWKGDIYPCIRYMPDSVGEEVAPLIIGTVDGGILAMDKQRGVVEVMSKVTRRSQSTDECFNCPIARGCAWCSAYNYQETGSVDKRVTYICEMHKARVLANIYYWNKLFKKKGENKVFQNNVPEDWALAIIDRDELDILNGLTHFDGMTGESYETLTVQ